MDSRPSKTLTKQYKYPLKIKKKKKEEEEEARKKKEKKITCLICHNFCWEENCLSLLIWTNFDPFLCT